MNRKVTHHPIVKFHHEIAKAHKEINGFYRFDFNEIKGSFRSGIGTPALLLESHSNDLSENQNKTASFSNRAISFLILDFTGAADDYDKQECVLDATENIALDIISYFKELYKKQDDFFKDLDLSRISIEKVGPIFDNMYGWNVTYTLKNSEPMCYDATKWKWPN